MTDTPLPTEELDEQTINAGLRELEAMEVRVPIMHPGPLRLVPGLAERDLAMLHSIVEKQSVGSAGESRERGGER